MIKPLKFFKLNKLNSSQRSHETPGFTLIELLVGMILASLIITPLLGLVINMMDTDRKEQAKSTSEQEIQAALDYIARDLDQAFFIYDGLGLQAIKADLPTVPNATGEPVLVFWKRQFRPKAIPVTGGYDDGFVYSLVGYYITTENNCGTSLWSCTSQIRRIELRDALYDANGDPISDEEASSGLLSIEKLLEKEGPLEKKLSELIDKEGNPVEGGPYTEPFQVLIDYIDHTPPDQVAVDIQPCSTETRPDGATRLDGVDFPGDYVSRQVPNTDFSGEFPPNSFYACVNSDQTVAQVFIRGNALARIRPKNPNETFYADNQKAYFPKANIQAQGSGLVTGDDSQ